MVGFLNLVFLFTKVLYFNSIRVWKIETLYEILSEICSVVSSDDNYWETQFNKDITLNFVILIIIEFSLVLLVLAV